MLPLLLAVTLAATPIAEPVPRTITVSGDSKLTFRPNQLVVTFLITTSQRDQASTRKTGDEKLDRFRKACVGAAVESRNIVVAENGVVPEYRGNEITGYVLNRTVTLTLTDMARVDEVLTGALRIGALQGVVMLQNTEHAVYETKARVAAATMARERAKGVTEALGARLGLPISVNERTPVVDLINGGSFAAAPDGSVTTSFAAREMTVTSQVTVQFDMLPPS